MNGDLTGYRYHCNEEGCSFQTDDRFTMKNHAAVLGHFGWTDAEAPVEAGVCTCGEERDHEIHDPNAQHYLYHRYEDVTWDDGNEDLADEPEPTYDNPTPVQAGVLYVTPMDSEGNVTGPPLDVAAQVRKINLSMPDTETIEVDENVFLPGTFTFDVSFNSVDPNLLALFHGAKPDDLTQPIFSVETYVPARRRTFWEWLTRKPKHLAFFTYVPNARVVEIEEEDSDD